jgi:hypothetical protein
LVLARGHLTPALQLRARRSVADRRVECFIGRFLAHKWYVTAAPVSCKR